MKLFSIGRITPRHPQIAKNELREEGQIESHENDQRRKLRPCLRIQPASDLWKPEMDTAQVCHHHSAHHHVMKVSDDEVGIRNVDIDGHGGEEKAGETSDRKEPYEAKRIQHGGIEGH